MEENKKYYVLKGVPLDKSTVEFDYYSVTIDKKSFLPILINFYKESDDNYRRVEAVEIQDVQGFPTVVRSKVSDLKTGGYTLMEFRNIKYNVGLDDDVFSERSLRNPPRRWLD
ncbi:outer membrane lipoprotein-sorting protein [Alkalimonas collagenimarina]|uniref:Outer membrane lipoprotein-sorting protein n=1 Tax=Alkalimonas collagenimarina TaxID=400390 RepID=A0ABT9H2U5_9GAMM|nr:outer membrane lipoprotein-sorting protein [Alkalimonas collagenimarina]MDP4537642.1 outer membrane lipoprotein-sorting protein [Alkalimonas collagenimarina]